MLIDFVDKTNNVRENFLQSLVLLYLPCETFSKTDSGENKLTVRAYEENGTGFAEVEINIGDRNKKTICSRKFSENKKIQIKNLIGEAFLKAAEEVFGYKSPWGIVTGIRPAKLAADYITKYDEKTALKILKNEYFVMPEKAQICVRTAKNELELTNNLEDKTASLYVSIPFCPSKCRYCSFVSSSTPRLLSLIPEYLDKLCKEFNDISETIKELGLKLKTIYIGGGTPAILEPDQIKLLLDSINNSFDTSGVGEYTFEAGRPDCITYEKLAAVKEYGVGRISINTQTANNEILRNVGRKHTFEDYKNCMNTARECGIECINTDLIAGLPGESAESFFDSVNKVIDTGAENITVHSFTLKRSSEYKTANSAIVDANSKVAQRMVEYAQNKLINSKYEPYYMYRQKNTVGNLDNTGFSIKGYECLYNIYMMGEYHTVFAAGAGSVSKFVSHDRARIERIFSQKYPYEYLDVQKYPGFDKKFAIDFYNKLY